MTFLEHDLNTWTDQAVEARDHVNLMYFFAFFARNMFLDFSSEICPVARYLCAKIICLCACTQENRKCLLAKVNIQFI